MGYIKGSSLSDIIDPEDDLSGNSNDDYKKVESVIYKMFSGKESYYFNIFNQIKSLNENNIFFYDLHFGNIMVINNDKNKKTPMLIDFGSSLICDDKREACIYQLSKIFTYEKNFIETMQCSDWAKFFRLKSPSQESKELTKFFFGTVGEVSFSYNRKESKLEENLKNPSSKMEKVVIDGVSIRGIYTGDFKKATSPLAKLLYQDFLRYNDQEKKGRASLINSLEEVDRSLLFEKIQNKGLIVELSAEIFYSAVREVITEKYERLPKSIQAKVNDLYFYNLQMDPTGLEALGIEPLKWDPMGLEALGLGDLGSKPSSLKSALGEPDKINLAYLADAMHYYQAK